MSTKANATALRSGVAGVPSIFVNSRCCGLPVWEDSQIAQENWGAPLAMPPTGGGEGVGKDAKQGNGKSKPPTTGKYGPAVSAGEAHFEDAATRQGVEAFIVACQPPSTSNIQTEEVEEGSSSPEILWLRPTEVFRPFRPVVHCNATPFVNPYATAEGRVPLDAKVEEARCQSLLSPGALSTNSSTTHHKSGNGGQQNDTSNSVPEAFHQLYPEAVTTLDMFSHEEREYWSHCTTTESVRRYRALPALMQPYDGRLVAGCAETPAEACESRYSTGLRHKLRQAEQLAALTQTPSFLMSAFNSALLAVEQAQRHVPEGWYLWELVHPHVPGTCHPVYNPFGKYAVKLFVDGAYRKVLVDDSLPVDVLGRPLLTTTSRRELWPCLVAKAVVKALGPITGLKALTSAPELVVATLLGNWVPQYFSPRHDTVSATAMLLVYQRQLAQLERLAEPLVKDTDACATGRGKGEGTGEVKTRDAKGNARDRQATPNLTQLKRTQSTNVRPAAGKRQRGRRGSGVSGGADEEGVELKPLRATEYCEPVIDEPLPEEHFYVCGLYAPSAETVKSESARTSIGGYGTGPQLCTIHTIKPFRNTVALLLHTTPRAGLSEGILKEEWDADDVSALHDWSRRTARNASHGGSSEGLPRALDGVESADVVGSQGNTTSVTDMVVIDSHRAPSVTSCWLTLEEFMAQMKSVILWRKLAGRYPNTVSVNGESLLERHGSDGFPSGGKYVEPSPSAASRKKMPSTRRGDASLAAGAASSIAIRSPAAPPSSIWWKLTAQKAVEAVVVVSCPARVDDVGGVAVSPKAPSTGPPSPAHRSASAESPPLLPSIGGSQESAETHLERRVYFRHFQWDRGEPLNDIGSLTYAQGMLRSTALHFRPGVHLVRVDLHHVQALDRISFLSDAAMEMQLALSHDANRDGFACVTDAGVYPAVQSCDEERVWLKRVFSITAPTCVTVQLSTLDPAEDLALHRQINTFANRTSVTTLGGKGTSNHAKAAVNGRGAPQIGSPTPASSKVGNAPPVLGATVVDGKKRGDVPFPADAKDGTASVAAASEVSVPILRFTSLLLLNLDRPEDYSLGVAGRLVKLQLEPNEKGYMLMAYTIVPAMEARGLQQSDQAADGAGDTLLSPSTVTLRASLAEDGQQEPAPPLLEPSCGVTASMEPPLFPAGRWKLVLRSNVELQAFDTVSHDLQNITIDAELQRGVSPILFHRVCTVSEVTHVSIKAHLRAPVPMPYKIRIMRLPISVAPPATPSNPRAARLLTSNTTLQSIPESTTVDAMSANGAASSRGSTMVVYESPLSDSRLFAPNVLLSPAGEAYAGKGGKGPTAALSAGGGMTLYVIEAAVSDEDAARWNERCRQSQEDMFLEYRRAAEERAAISHQQEVAEYRSDPVAYMRRKEEASAQRRQLATEAAEKALSRSVTANSSTSSVRKRSTPARRHSSQSPTALDSSIKDSFPLQSSLLQPDCADEAAVEHDLDAANLNLAVRMTVRLSLSSSRAEVKPEAPAPDAYGELRRRMKETVSWLQEWGESGSPAGEAMVASTLSVLSATTITSGGRSAVQRAQRDAAAAAAATMEDALHAEAARQSRGEYLRNPQHLFFPLCNASDNVETAGCSGSTSVSFPHRSKHDANASSSGSGVAHSTAGSGPQSTRNPRKESGPTSLGITIGSQDDHLSALYMLDESAKHFRYAVPLQPPQYRIELLPLRSWEESPPVALQGKDGAAGAGVAAPVVSSRGKRVKAPSGSLAVTPVANRAHSNAPGISSACSAVAAAAAAASTLSCPLTNADREGMILPMNRPLIEASESWDSSVTLARLAKSENQSLLKNSFQAYFLAMAEKKGRENAETTGTTPPLVFHSLLGAKEEDPGSLLKPKKSSAAT
ncbi:hypothetical protein JKF63_02459 [Porcisia hertigi]|uniref:Calpain catalytic domain-containing protein n=1 Tax=Porcisia hertigi TaxID=2761500 RepID=A0A836I9J7_9TRYP|nr:hypothetical protein JKF63_02459 [Porcisia hertigi]